MNQEQLKRMNTGQGFIAALDQSGGSTPKALKQYGISEDQFSNDDEMFALVHEMRTRIITSPSFTSATILGAILFKNTMNRKIEGKYTADFLWENKGIVPILKVDEGLATLEDGVQLMKPFSDLKGLMVEAGKRNVFGTKMRSVIKEANPKGIQKIVAQQFEMGQQIADLGFVPILEPEVDIYSVDKTESEQILKTEILSHLANLDNDTKIMFKLSIPTVDNFYSELMDYDQVVRVVALSGGYSQSEANERLSRNKGLIASFSRALSQGLHVDQSEEEFDAMLKASIKSIYEASIA